MVVVKAFTIYRQYKGQFGINETISGKVQSKAVSLDPKGILLGDNHFNNPKILWCKHDVKTLEAKIQQQLAKDKKDAEVCISGFILSVTPYETVQKDWGAGTGTTKEQFAENKVLFIEQNKEYLTHIFANLK